MSITNNARSMTNGATANLELDVPKLHALPSEQQDLYLLTFTSDLAHHISHLGTDGASAQQLYLKKELFQIINLPSPSATRAVRNNLGRCFAGIFSKGDRKLLFDSINELLAIINAGKGEKELKGKHAAVHCLGDIFGAAGDSAISLSSLTCSSLLRLLKSAQNHAGLRSSIYNALAKLFKIIGSSLDESIARDVWKQARIAAAGDKASLVQTSAARCLEQLIRGTSSFDNSNDLESLKSTFWKATDNPAPLVRHAAASCLAAMLVKSFSEDASKESVPIIKKPKKPSKRQTMDTGDAEEIQRPDSPGPKKQPTQLSFDLPGLLKQLSTQYTRTSTSNRVRAAIVTCYIKIFKGLKARNVETQYSKITDHLLFDLLDNSSIVHNRYRLLITRKFVHIILEDVVGRQILGETGQLSAAKLLVNDVLKNYPQVIKERVEPNKHTLTAALSALASLITSLGSATSSIADSCRDSLLQVLQHPSYTVQIATSYCLRAFVLSCPHQLLPCVSVCMNSVNRELNLLSTLRHSSRRCVGYANGLAAVLSTAALQPLYGSVDVNSRVLSLATGLLKSSGNSEIRISSTQIQVAWILMGGLMSLGPNFVKIHLSQLLLLWKNALPKPLLKENMAQRTVLELSFLAHVRECALGSILTFLEFNSRLLTSDVSKRLAAMLQNTIAFMSGFPFKKTTEDPAQRLSPSLHLQDLDLMLRRRVLQCYTKLVNLSPSGGGETLLQSNLLTLAVSFFADPDDYSPRSLSTSIASSAGSFENVWDVGDNCGFGVTGLIRGLAVKRLPGEHSANMQAHWLVRSGAEASIDQILLSPICGAREHDSVSLYTSVIGDTSDPPDPPATEVVNSAINLFATALPLQAPKVQESILEQVATFLTANVLHRDPGRKAAMTVNIAMALLATLKVAVNETSCSAGDLRASAVEKIMQEMLRDFVKHPDQLVRNIAYEALGRLCSSSGNTFTTTEINYLVNTIVANRDPNARAGCAVALGCIHSHVGGMAAGYHLRTILSILMSLGNDPHPTVHFWALEALSRVADSAGLTFSGYVSSSLGMLAQLYVADTHNEEAASMATSNLEIEYPTPAVIARCIDSLVNVLGPDLQEMTKARDLILTLVQQFQAEQDSLVLVEGLRCLEHVYLYASGHMEFAPYVQRLQTDLKSPHGNIREVAVDGLYNLMKRDAKAVLNAAVSGLEDQLWDILVDIPNQEGIRNIISNWLQQTSLSDTDLWVERCQKVLTKTKTRQENYGPVTATKTAVDLQDEEVAGFAAAAGIANSDGPVAPGAGSEPLKWQVQIFAMSCLSELLAIVSNELLSNEDTPAKTALQHRIADLIRLAFSASTSNVIELRVSGLRIIDQVLKIFGKTPDPDFTESSLLEQYQAQISSALTPAFAADSSPELASEAINVCAVFIATGIVTDVDRMGRILKLLVSALEDFSRGSETVAIGDLQGLSSNAQVMVKLAIYSAWAELQVASLEQAYLVEFYQDSWLYLVDAIASLIEQDSGLVFDALDGKIEGPTTNGTLANGNEINYRDEPVAFFFVLFGIAFEALVTRPGNDPHATKEQTLDILMALKKILRPLVSGHAIYQEVVFSETMDLLDRLVLTEGLDVQTVTVEIARNLCIAHPSANEERHSAVAGDNLSEDIDQLFELTRIIVLVLSGLLPKLSDPSSQARENLSEEAVSLICLSLDALVDAAEVFPSVIKTDLHACIIHIFATILGTGVCQAAVLPRALPILKRFVASFLPPAEGGQEDPMVITQFRGCLKRFLSILINARKKDTEASIACVRNTLLASTILVTGGSSLILPNEALLMRLLDRMVDCLEDKMISRVASNCIRSLLLTTPKTSTDQSIAHHLIPHLLTYLTSTSISTAALEPSDNTRPLILHTLTSLTPTLSSLQKPTYLSLLLPTMLTRARTSGSAVYRETAARILELAGMDQVAFRSVVGRLGVEQRAFMESVIRDGGKRGAEGDGNGEGKMAEERPSIALKMDFGGVS
ncbi:MAG: hypothetical protein M1827_003566 [Pycnora praestabilis]|nr:MAG: hypothetical protein M1827_003566 [Pycnora praestabilis]